MWCQEVRPQQCKPCYTQGRAPTGFVHIKGGGWCDQGGSQPCTNCYRQRFRWQILCAHQVEGCLSREGLSSGTDKVHVPEPFCTSGVGCGVRRYDLCSVNRVMDKAEHPQVLSI